jgi:lambda family phage portal protein
MFARLRRSLADLIDSRRSVDAASLGPRRGPSIGRFGPVNAEIAAAGRTVAARARKLAVDDPLCRGAVQKLVADIVGADIRPAPRANADTTMPLWDSWTEVADADGRTNVPGIIAQAVHSAIVNGEALLIAVTTESGLQYRLIDPEQLDRSMTRRLDNGGWISQGVEFSADGTRTAYWIFRQRDDQLAVAWAPPARVDARDVLHVFRADGPGQTRGLSWLTSVVLPAAELNKLLDAGLMSAQVAAMFAAFLTSENDFSGADPFAGGDVQGIEPGTMVRLGAGQKVTIATPQAFQGGAELLKAIVRQIAAGIGVPAWLVDGDMTQVNYSSARVALIPYRTGIEQFRWTVLVPQLLAPIWRRWVETEILFGRLPEGDYAADWVFPAFMSIDPSKDVAADREEVDAGFASRAEKIRARGWNPADVDAERAADRQREDSLGLTPKPAPSPQPGDPSQQNTGDQNANAQG